MKRLAPLLAALFLPSVVPAREETSGWLDRLHLSAAATVSAVDNLSRTSFEPARCDATTYELTVGSAHARQLAPSLLLVATGEAASFLVPDFDLDNHVRLGARLALQKKFGLGPQATLLQWRAAATWKAARLDDDRGWTGETGVELARRVLPNLRLAASATWLGHNARRDVFDLSQHGWSVDARWDIDDRWSLAASAGRLSGDIVANATWATWGMMLAGDFGPAVFDYYTSRPWRTTGLFGPGWVSYNVEADVDLWSVTLGCALSDRTSLEVHKASAYVVNAVGVAYPTGRWSLALNHRF